MRKSTRTRKIFIATFAGLGLVVLLLTGCSGGAIDKVRDLNVSSAGAGPFAAALAGEYRTLALFEADRMGDKSDAGRYARKALLAAAGDAPEPDRIHDRDLSDDMVDEISALRRRLLAAAGRITSPEAAARARAGFDCWLEQLEEGFQPTHIAACRSVFLNAMAEAEAMLPTAFVTFFDNDSARLTDDGVDAAARAARIVQDADGFDVLVSGHADRAGPAEYNLRLSEKRAGAVRDRLIAYGVAADHIRTNVFGETRPLVATPDGVPERKNRRVEIAISLDSGKLLITGNPDQAALPMD